MACLMPFKSRYFGFLDCGHCINCRTKYEYFRKESKKITHDYYVELYKKQKVKNV